MMSPSLPPRPIPLLGAKSSVLRSAAMTEPGGGASGVGGTTSMREAGLCGAPARRLPEGKSRALDAPARCGLDTEKVDWAREWWCRVEPAAEDE